MIKKMRTVLTALLAVIITLTSNNIAFAFNNTGEANFIFKENGKVYDAKVVTKNGCSTVYLNDDIITYDRNSNILTVNDHSYIINTNSFINSINKTMPNMPYAVNNTASAKGISNSYDGYSYDYYSKKYNNRYYTFWELSIPDNVKLTYQTNLNNTNLTSFKQSVDDIVDNYNDLVDNGYGSAVTVVLTAIGLVATGLIGGIVMAILSSLGFASPLDAVSSFTAMRTAQDNAKTYFNNIISVSIPY